MTTSGSRQRHHGLPDPRDLELESLRQERDELLARERMARAEAETAQRRLSELSAASRKFASSMRGLSGERQQFRRRLGAQYAVSRVLADAASLEKAAPGVLDAVGRGLCWDLGAFWMIDEGAGVLVCVETWRSPEMPPGPFEQTVRRMRFPRGLGLPGRVWSAGTAICVEDVTQEAGLFRKETAAEEGMRRALAFPVRDGGRPLGVVEFLSREAGPVDEDLLRTSNLIGHHIGQFAERRRAEEERERLLWRERVARTEAERAHERVRSTLESISDAFVSLDWERRFTYVNREAESLWGKGRDQLLGRKVWEVFPEMVGTESYRAVERSIKERITVRFENPFATGDRWISGTIYPSGAGVSVYFRDISEQKRAEEELRASETRYRTVIEQSPVAILVFAPDGRSLRSNDAWREIWEPDESPASPNVFDDERVRTAGLMPYLEKGAAGCTVATEPLFYDPARAGREGEPRWLEAFVYPIREDGVISEVTLMLEDVTERKGAAEEREDLRREAEAERANLEAILQQMPGGVFISDPSGRIVLANEGTERIYGKRISSVEECGRHAFSYPDGQEIPPEHYPLNRALAGEYIYGMEHYALCDDGTRRVLRANAAPVRDEDGRIVAAVKAFQDVTPHKEVETALMESEERFRSLIQHASDIITVLEADGTIRYESPSVGRILGYDPEEMVGEPALGYVHPDDVRRVRAVGAGLLEQGGITRPLELRFRHKDGSWRYLESISTNLLDEPSVRGIVINSRDVTERKRIEESRDRYFIREREARDEAEAAQERLAFLAGASEERRRISRELHDRVAHSMGVVHQSLELHRALKDRDAEAAGSKLALARELAKNALESTRDLSIALRDSEVEEGLGPALSKLLGTTIPPEVRYAVSVEGDEDLVPPHARDQVFLILREAVRNAATHSGASQITVELDVSPERTVGRVEDDGRGFDPKKVDKKGSNGIRSMRERASLLGGSLELIPGKDGRGTTVEVVVPLGGDR